MSNENKTIHDFEFNLICDFFSNMERQGPGSPEVTLKALSFVDGLTDESLIADIGCGTGGQTMVLAQNVPGKIIGLDFLPNFIEIFNRNASAKVLSSLNSTLTGYSSHSIALLFILYYFSFFFSSKSRCLQNFRNSLRRWSYA